MARVILHIDDQPQLPDDFAAALEREGYELLQTRDPEEAIRLVKEREPALVLMELGMAGCDGLDLLEGIRACSADPSGVPVLVLTRASRSSGLYGEAVAVGVSDFLSKPVLASQLLASILEFAPPPPKVEEPTPTHDPSSADLSGDLGDTPLAEVLARLRRRGATGVLLASCGKTRVGVQLRNGSPVAVSANRQRAPLDAEMSALSAGELESAISRRAEAELFEAFRWTDGSYRFAEDRRLRSEGVLEIARDPASLLLAGVLEASPLEQIRDRLRKRAPLYVSTAEQSESPLEGVELSRAQEQLLQGLGGEDTLAEILESNAFEERLLYGLWVAGRLELHAAPTLALIEELPGDPDEAESEPAGADTPPSPADAREELARSLRDLAQRVMTRDDFEALDVPVFAPDAQLRAAYERILQEIPEEALTTPDPELRERATRIRDRVEAAYEHLKDPETRRAYALLRREEEQDRDAKPSAERALEAERWFRKGEGFLRGKRYDRAAEAFGMASHLDPDQGEYLSHLGYALYLSNPSESVVQREAMEHIANGIKRSPMRELSYVYLGRILRAKGENDTARKVFRRALRIKPDSHPALQELRLLELRERRGKGILSRLWRR